MTGPGLPARDSPTCSYPASDVLPRQHGRTRQTRRALTRAGGRLRQGGRSVGTPGCRALRRTTGRRGGSGGSSSSFSLGLVDGPGELVYGQEKVYASLRCEGLFYTLTDYR